jgi:hypothetical protein
MIDRPRLPEIITYTCMPVTTVGASQCVFYTAKQQKSR